MWQAATRLCARIQTACQLWVMETVTLAYLPAAAVVGAAAVGVVSSMPGSSAGLQVADVALATSGCGLLCSISSTPCQRTLTALRRARAC